jgi:hypothetical protein
MLTLRVSPIEVQVDVMIYTFDDPSIANDFEASALAADPQFFQWQCAATRKRPVDADHEVGNLF